LAAHFAERNTKFGGGGKIGIGKRVERILNHRPRKRLGYLTPHEVFMLGRLPVAVHGRM